MALSWTTLENAIVAAVKTASGYSTGSVRWDSQDGEAPSGSYINLKLGDLIAPDIAQPSQVRTFDSGADPGTEITHTFSLPRRFTVSVQVFTPAITTGSTSARAVAASIQNKLVLPSTRLALRLAGLGLLDVGDVRFVPEIKGTKFEGRAILEPEFFVLDSATEQSTYISTVNAERDE